MASPTPATTPQHLPSLIIGSISLGVALAASIALAQQHLGGWDLPGCGGDSPCAQLSHSFWGKVPGTAWPISFVGAAYYWGVLIALLVSGGRLTSELRWVVRVGILISLFYIGIMLSEGLTCSYCLASHIGHAIFWIMIELTGRPWHSRTAPHLLMFAGFLGLSILFGVLEAQSQADVEAERQKAIEDILAGSEAPDANAAPLTETPPTPTTANANQPAPSAPEKTAEPSEQAQPANTANAEWSRPEMFTGRRLLGPEEALLRIVVFSSFQCRSCQIIENEIETLLEKYPDEINFSMKHFPMGTACNAYTDRDLHPNSCWAARAAEATAILHGDEAYWDFHHWLFKRRGSFTSEELNAHLDELGYDRNQFTGVLTGDETLARVQADIREGYEYGLLSTPMVFINGVEFKGWNLKDGLTRAVDQIVTAMRQQGQQPRDAANDRPPLAMQKYVNDFKARRVREIAPDSRPWSRGPEEAPLHVVVWGDYQERLTRVASQAVTEYAEVHGNVRFSFRHFPVNSDCNPHMNIPTKYPDACRMAHAAEAAGTLGGADAYWAMHTWLLTQQKTFSDAGLREFAISIGLDADALLAAMADSATADASILEDINAARALGIRSVPLININGRTVGPWQRQSDPTPLRLILDEAEKMALTASESPMTTPTTNQQAQ